MTKGAKRSWRTDYEAVKQDEDRRALLKQLTADLPINSVIRMDVVDHPNPDKKGEKVHVVRSIRNDPLARMYSHSQIDSAQYTAGRMWQEFYGDAEIGSVRAIDTTKEAVDGGRLPEPLTDRQKRATRKLKDAYATLGPSGSALVHDVLADGKMMKEVAEKRGMTGKAEILYFGMRFRECLESLAILWKLAPPKLRY